MSEHSDRTFSTDFKRFFLRGLVILLPSVLTLWLIVMAYQFVDKNIAEPINRGVRLLIVNAAPHFKPIQDAFDPTEAQIRSRFRELRAAGRRVPGDDVIRAELRDEHRSPTDADVAARREEMFEQGVPVPGEDALRAELRQENIREWWHQRPYMNLIGLVIAIIAVYTSGRLLGGYFGRKIYQRIEKIIVSIPIFKQVYPSVKQVVDFLFSDDQPMKFNRVVVTEYPRKGIWSVGFLTGPTLRSVAEYAGDAVTIFIPSSPTPFTGYTITVPRSEVIEIPLTVDDAIRFAVSGGVLIPDSQQIKPGTKIKGRLLGATEGETIPLTVATGHETVAESNESGGNGASSETERTTPGSQGTKEPKHDDSAST